MDALIDQLVDALKHIDNIQLPTPEDKRPVLDEALKDLQMRRKRWMDLYERGDLDPDELSARVHKLDEQIPETHAELTRLTSDLSAANATRDHLRLMAKAVNKLPTYLRSGDRAAVNADLHAILKYVTIKQDKTITLNWI